jgi:hypothetical protein
MDGMKQRQYPNVNERTADSSQQAKASLFKNQESNQSISIVMSNFQCQTSYMTLLV